MRKRFMGFLVLVMMVISLVSAENVYADTVEEDGWVILHDGYDVEGDWITIQYYKEGNTYTQLEANINISEFVGVTVEDVISQEADRVIDRATAYRDEFLLTTDLSYAMNEEFPKITIVVTSEEYLAWDYYQELYADGWNYVNLNKIWEGFDGMEKNRFELYKLLDGEVERKPMPTLEEVRAVLGVEEQSVETLETEVVEVPTTELVATEVPATEVSEMEVTGEMESIMETEIVQQKEEAVKKSGGFMPLVLGLAVVSLAVVAIFCAKHTKSKSKK